MESTLKCTEGFQRVVEKGQEKILDIYNQLLELQMTSRRIRPDRKLLFRYQERQPGVGQTRNRQVRSSTGNYWSGGTPPTTADLNLSITKKQKRENKLENLYYLYPLSILSIYKYILIHKCINYKQKTTQTQISNLLCINRLEAITYTFCVRCVRWLRVYLSQRFVRQIRKLKPILSASTLTVEEIDDARFLSLRHSKNSFTTDRQMLENKKLVSTRHYFGHFPPWFAIRTFSASENFSAHPGAQARENSPSPWGRSTIGICSPKT